MSPVRYVSLGPLLAGEGSRAFLGLSLEDSRPPVPVVLVWAPPDIAQDPDLTARLEKETERAVVFEHPNILRVHGLTRLDGGLARVTEFADGEPLRRLLELNPRLPAPFAALVVADAAMGLHYAHVAGNDDGSPLVHGDIRPETLMVSFSGLTKVTGYGALSVAPRERGGKRVKNRRAYSSPEQLLGGREAVNVMSDVFLLGLVLHECLTGKMPFKESADPDKAVLNRALPPMPNDVPLKLDAVVRKATSKRALDRYPSALAFREALVEAVGKLPTYESFAEFLAKMFPPDSDARGARRKLIELGAAEAMRKAGVPTPQVAEILAGGIGITAPPQSAPGMETAPQAAPRITGSHAVVASGPRTTGSHPIVAATPDAAPRTTGSHPIVATTGSHSTVATTGSHPTVAAAPATGAATPHTTGSHPTVGSGTTPGGTSPQSAAPVATSGSTPTIAGASASAGSAQGAAPLPTNGSTTAANGPASPASTEGNAPAPGAASATASPVQASGPQAPPSGPAQAHAAPPKKGSRFPLIVTGLVLTLGAAAVVLKPSLIGSMTVESTDGGVVAVAAAPSEVDAGAVEDAGTDAGTEDAGVDAGEQLGVLELFVEPRVDVTFNNTLLGRTPLTTSLPPGRHTLTLTSGTLGISVARTVTITAGSKTSQQIYLNKAFINVRGPEGASVTIDGRPVGTVPVEELDVYEGYHRLLVTVGGARWQKSFQIEPGQRVNFDVDFQEPPEE